MKKNFLLLLLSAILLSSCQPEYEIKRSIDAVILKADKSIKAVGETITFTVKDNTGVELTDAVLYINGEELDGNTFTSEETGNFEVKARYLGINSEPLAVRFHDGSETNFVKRVLIEDYTGTWCGYCPRVAYGIELVKEQTHDYVAVAIHRPSSTPSSPVYDPYNYDATELENTLDAEGYPKGFLNRRTQWNFPEPENIAQVISLTQGENPKLDLAMETIKNGNTLDIDVNVKFSQDFSNLKLVVYVLENGLLYEQHNYTTYYGGVDILQNFPHNHVLRAVLTPILGEPISGSETIVNNVYTRTFSIPVPSNVANANNVEIVAFVLDQNGNAVNVRQAGLNVTQDFEEL